MSGEEKSPILSVIGVRDVLGFHNVIFQYIYIGWSLFFCCMLQYFLLSVLLCLVASYKIGCQVKSRLPTYLLCNDESRDVAMTSRIQLKDYCNWSVSWDEVIICYWIHSHLGHPPTCVWSLHTSNWTNYKYHENLWQMGCFQSLIALSE